MRAFWLFLLCILWSCTAFAVPFYSRTQQTAIDDGYLFCDEHDKTVDLSWNIGTGSSTMTQTGMLLGVYPDGGDAVGITLHTITANGERMRGSTGTTNGLLFWDGSRTITYEFGERIIDSYNGVTGAESTHGILNRVSGGGFYFGASFRWITTISTTQLLAHTADGAAETSVPLAGVNPFGWHRFKIVLSKTPRTASFYVDNVLVATIATTLPATTTVLSPGVRTARFAATATYLSWHDYECLRVTR